MDNKYDKLIKWYDSHCTKIKRLKLKRSEETPEQIARRRSEKEQEGYIAWFEEYFEHYAKCKSADFHQELADMIINDPKSKTLAEIYRSGAKSVHVTVGIPLYLYFTDRLRFMLLIGRTEPKAKKLLGALQAELEYNPKLIKDYGKRIGDGNWAEGNFYTTDGCRFMSFGFDQDVRGLREGADRPDYIVLDDCDTKKSINNNTIMAAAMDKVLEDIMGCFDAADDATERFVFANNNFHKNGLTNRLKTEFLKYQKIDKEEGNVTMYYILSACAVKDLVSFEPTWPAKTTAAYWKAKYQKRPNAFLREYMHKHVAEGKLFKMTYMQWKGMHRLSEYEALILIGDLSYKVNGDYKSMFLIGKKGREFHIIKSFTRQCSRADVAKWLYDMYEDDGLANENIRYLIDGLFAQDEFINDFDIEGDERGFYIAILPNKKSYGDKADHIESILGFFQRLWVFWNIDEKEHIDQITAIDQFLSFEKGGDANDDAPDAVAVGFKELQHGAVMNTGNVSTVSIEDIINQSENSY